MVEKTPDDAPDNLVVPPKFPGQTYRDRELSAESKDDDSDSAPKSISSIRFIRKSYPMMLTWGPQNAFSGNPPIQARLLSPLE